MGRLVMSCATTYVFLNLPAGGRSLGFSASAMGLLTYDCYKFSISATIELYSPEPDRLRSTREGISLFSGLIMEVSANNNPVR